VKTKRKVIGVTERDAVKAVHGNKCIICHKTETGRFPKIEGLYFNGILDHKSNLDFLCSHYKNIKYDGIYN
jgi:hypothetical protein